MLFLLCTGGSTSGATEAPRSTVVEPRNTRGGGTGLTVIQTSTPRKRPLGAVDHSSEDLVTVHRGGEQTQLRSLTDVSVYAVKVEAAHHDNDLRREFEESGTP